MCQKLIAINCYSTIYTSVFFTDYHFDSQRTIRLLHVKVHVHTVVRSYDAPRASTYYYRCARMYILRDVRVGGNKGGAEGR